MLETSVPDVTKDVAVIENIVSLLQENFGGLS